MMSIQCYCAGIIRGRRFIGGLVLRAGVLLAVLAASSTAQQPARPPLTDADISDITRLVMLEDRRELDEAALARILRSAHPEVRRRAALAIGRIADARGRSLLVAARTDRDTAASHASADTVHRRSGALCSKDIAGCSTGSLRAASQPRSAAGAEARWRRRTSTSSNSGKRDITMPGLNGAASVCSSA